MAKEPSPPSPDKDVDAVVAELLSDEDHLELTLESLQRFLKPAAVLVVLVLIGTVGFGIYRNNQRTNEISAGKRLFAAQDATGLQEVIDNFPATSHAQTARLLQARQYFEEGAYEQALDAYSQVADSVTEEPYGAPATIGRLYALEALGQLDEAFEGFTQFADSHPGHYYELDARRSAARCLTQLGRYEEAREAYQAYIDDNPAHPSVAIAEAQLAYLKRVAR